MKIFPLLTAIFLFFIFTIILLIYLIPAPTKQVIKKKKKTLGQLKKEGKEDYLNFLREFSKNNRKDISLLKNQNMFSNLYSNERNALLSNIDDNNRFDLFDINNKFTITKYSNIDSVIPDDHMVISTDELYNIFSYIYICLFCDSFNNIDKDIQYNLFKNREQLSLFLKFIGALNIYFYENRIFISDTEPCEFTDEHITIFTEFMKNELLNSYEYIEKYIIEKIRSDRNIIIVD